MKNRIIFTGMALIATALFACKDKSVFTLSGTVEHPGSLKKIYLLQSDTNRISLVDSTNLGEDGKFQFKRNMPYANLFKLRIGGSIFDLIAQNGQEITFKTDLNDDKHAYEINGSADALKIQEFNKLSNTFTEQNTQVMSAYQAEAEKLGKESDSLMQAFMPQVRKIQSDYSNAVLKYIRDNEASLAAFYAATSLDQSRYERQLVAYSDDINGGFKDNPSVQAFIKEMQAIKPISVGHKAPDFTIGSVDGKPISLSDYQGKYVMLDFWASWCPPCRAEMPNVVKQYAAFKGKGLNILGISLDETQQNWKKGIADLKMTWPQASDLKKWDGPTEQTFHVQAIPANFIIDPYGIIVAKNLSGAELEDFLKKTFR